MVGAPLHKLSAQVGWLVGRSVDRSVGRKSARDDEADEIFCLFEADEVSRPVAKCNPWGFGIISDSSLSFLIPQFN